MSEVTCTTMLPLCRTHCPVDANSEFWDETASEEEFVTLLSTRPATVISELALIGTFVMKVTTIVLEPLTARARDNDSESEGG